jgi:hypothetical protein
VHTSALPYICYRRGAVNDPSALPSSSSTSSQTTWELIWWNSGKRHTQEFSDQAKALTTKKELEQEGFEVEIACLAKLFG